MKRLILVVCIAAVLAVVAAGVWVYVRRSDSRRGLLKAQVALKADQTPRALALAREYTGRFPDDWKGHFVQALAQMRLGEYVSARQSLERAQHLEGADPSVTVALAETYMLPALQSVESADGPAKLAALQSALEQIAKAGEVLAGPAPSDPTSRLGLRQMAASVTAELARVHRQIAQALANEAQTAQAGGAEARARQLQDESDQSARQADRLQDQAMVKLSEFLADARAQLEGASPAGADARLVKHIDAGGRDLIAIGMELDEPARWQQIRQALAGLEEAAPVPAMQVVVYEVARRPFDTHTQRRSALQAACEQVDAALAKLPEPAGRRELLLARAQLAMALRDPITAERLCEEVLADAPNQPMARFILARSLLAQKQYGRAERILFTLRMRLPGSPEIAIAYAQAARAAGSAELAHQAILEALEIDPANAPARQLLIDEYLGRGFPARAYSQARQYYDHCPDDPVALTFVIRAALAAGRRTEVENLLEEVVRRESPGPELLTVAAEGFDLLGYKDRSAKAALAAVRAPAATMEARLARARALALGGDVQRAEILLARELADNGDRSAVHFEIARLHAAAGRGLQAIDHYRAAIRRNPLSSTYGLALARALLADGSLGPCQEALASLPANDARANLLRLQLRVLAGDTVSPVEALSLASSQPQAALPLALAYFHNGQTAQCLEVCLAELGHGSEDIGLRILAGQACVALGQFDSGVEHMAKAVAAEPSRMDLYMQTGSLLARRLPADQLAKRLAAISGARADLAHLAAGWVLSRHGRHDQVVQLCRNLAEREDVLPTVRRRAKFMLAHGLASTGQLPEALVELEELAANSRWRKRVGPAKAQLLARSGRREEARGVLDALRADARAQRDAAQLASLVGLYREAGSDADALAVCDDLLALPGNERLAELLKAGIHRAVEQFDQAAAAYRRAIAALPSDLAARLALAEVLDGAHKPLESLAALDQAQALGRTGRIVAGLARAQLLTRWGLRQQARRCLADIQQLDDADSPRIRLALGEALAGLGAADDARACLQAIGPYAAQYVSARLALARLAGTPAEALAVLDAMPAPHSNRDDVLAEVLAALIGDGRPRDAAERFDKFVRTRRAEGSWPERTALLVFQAELEATREPEAYRLARRMHSQTGRDTWRQLALLLEPAGATAGEKVAPKGDDPIDAAIVLARAAAGGDDQAAQQHAESFERLCAAPEATVASDIRILAALATRGPAPADRIYRDVAGRRLVGVIRLAAIAAMARSDGPKLRQQAGRLLHSRLALKLGAVALGRRLAKDLLADDPTCVWAAALAIGSAGDPAEREKLLAALRPGDGPAAQAIRAGTAMDRGEYERAAEAYGVAADASDDDPALRLRQAVALERVGRIDQAMQVYRALTSAPHVLSAAAAANNAAFIHATRHGDDPTQLAQAYAWAQAAVRAAPNVPTFRDTKGWIAHLLGRRQEACRELRRALVGMSDSPEVHEHLADAEAAAGNAELAQWHRQASRELRSRAAEDDTVAAGAGGEPGSPR